MKSESLADQKMETTPLQRQRHPDQKAETSKLRFLKSVSLADQKMETPKGRDTLIKRQTPKLRFLVSVLLRSLAD